MGSVEPYETRAGRRYRVHYRDPDRKSREKGGFTRKKDAEDYLANVTVATNKGEYVDPITAKVTIGELGAVWIANKTSKLKASSYRSIETAWRVHVAPVWGERRLSDIRHSDVQTWVSGFTGEDGEPRSATVVLRAYGVLAAIMDVAVRDRRVSTNVARGVDLPRKAKKPRVYLTAAQVELLAANAGEWGSFVHLLAYTGLRTGEAVGLRVGALDMLRRRINVQENAVLVGSKVIVGTPKTHENRSVPFAEFLTEPLARACEGSLATSSCSGRGSRTWRASSPTRAGSTMR